VIVERGEFDSLGSVLLKIQGDRYRCHFCGDFDYCTTCYEGELGQTHPHTMLK